MKHVWILNHYAQEPSRAGGTRHYCLAKELEAFGWNATIIAASVDHSTGEQRLNNGIDRQICDHDGVRFCWLKTPAYSGNGLGRILNILKYTFAALNPSLGSELTRPDAIIGSSVHPLAAWAGMRLARRHNVPFLFEVRDLWPQTLIDVGWLKQGSPTARMLRLLERQLFREAKRIIVLLPKASDYITPLGIPQEKIVWIPNGVDLNLFPQPEQPEESDALTLYYTGAHGVVNGLETLLQAMSLVEQRRTDNPVTLHLVGDGPQKQNLEKKAKKLGLQNVKFDPPVPKSDLPKVIAAANGFVMCLRDLPVLYRYGISSNKIFDYMASGRPTIISTGATDNPIAHAEAGITVPPEDPSALAEAILKLAAMPLAARHAMGQAAREHVETKYGFKILAGRLADTLNASESL